MLSIRGTEDLKDDKVIYAVLIRSGVLDGTFDYRAFDDLAGRASQATMPDYDYSEMLQGFESVMRQLGVMPFDESILPSEDPSTF